jgi:hypothetical protein
LEANMTEGLDQVLRVCVTSAEREELEEKAAADGRKVSNLVRMILREWLVMQQVKARSRGGS